GDRRPRLRPARLGGDGQRDPEAPPRSLGARDAGHPAGPLAGGVRPRDGARPRDADGGRLVPRVHDAGHPRAERSVRGDLLRHLRDLGARPRHPAEVPRESRIADGAGPGQGALGGRPRAVRGRDRVRPDARDADPDQRAPARDPRGARADPARLGGVLDLVPDHGLSREDAGAVHGHGPGHDDADLLREQRDLSAEPHAGLAPHAIPREPAHLPGRRAPHPHDPGHDLGLRPRGRRERAAGEPSCPRVGRRPALPPDGHLSQGASLRGGLPAVPTGARLHATPAAAMPATDTLRVRRAVLWALLASKLLASWGVRWDIQWHVRIGRDSFWIPPHVMTYAGVSLVVLVSFGVLLWETYAASVTRGPRGGPGTIGRRGRAGRAG